jgi:hypothetical protein
MLFNSETNDKRQQATSAIGTFSFTALPPGKYRLEVEKAGLIYR